MHASEDESVDYVGLSILRSWTQRIRMIRRGMWRNFDHAVSMQGLRASLWNCPTLGSKTRCVAGSEDSSAIHS